MKKSSDRWIALALGSGFFALYLMTLCRTVFWYDSAEFVTAASVLGIPHPPGYPLYTLMGHVFTWLPIDNAIAVNLMSACFAALAVSLVFLLGRRLELPVIASLVGAALLGASSLFWENAIIAEVYCPNLAAIAAVTYWLLRGTQERRSWMVFAAAGTAGLGLGIHLSIATCGLGFAILVWASDREGPTLRALLDRQALASRLKRSLLAIACVCLGACVFLYLPIRASMDPILNFENPSTWKSFKWHITGGNFEHYFSDVAVLTQAKTIGGFFLDQLHIVGLVLAGIGAAWLSRRRPIDTLALLAMAGGNVVYFFDYRVHDQNVFFLPTTLILALFCAAGAAALLELLQAAVRPELRTKIGVLLRCALVAFAISIALGNYHEVDMSDFDETDEFIEEVIRDLPPRAVILNFTLPEEWRLDAVFGMYVQKLKRQRLDVRIFEIPTPRAVLELLRLGHPVYAYAPTEGLSRLFVIEPHGSLWRVVAPRGQPKP